MRGADRHDRRQLHDTEGGQTSDASRLNIAGGTEVIGEASAKADRALLKLCMQGLSDRRPKHSAVAAATIGMSGIKTLRLKRTKIWSRYDLQ